ncbi:DNA-binding protein [Enterococcus italicus]|jgi:hypothetical protein|uniref:DNA-binding protein n=1 Tax=Enterococcus italicus TaxID=246144 RepID=UPI0020736155|nr:DNA-binding protein [Enterococcus italicus]MCM6882156.1 DNA-binding protein [Enterococcus italicus]
MNENLKTIKELAEEIGVSKTAINKKVTIENRKTWFTKIGNRFVINEVGQKAIKYMFLENIENQKSKTKNQNRKLKSQNENLENKKEPTGEYKYLLEIIDYQKEQIKDLKYSQTEQFKQLSSMQNLLDQQQQLALQDKKLLETYKEENEQLTARSLPAIQKEQQAQVELERLKDEVHFLQEQLAKKERKKWYHFFKK